jgi:ketosteroid isomerase-like protein
MDNPNVALLQRMMAAVGADDWEAVGDCLTDDFVIVEPPLLPYSGAHHGVAGFRHMVDSFRSTWADMDIDVNLVGALDDTVIFKVVLRATSTATGHRVEAAVAEFFTVRDGRIAASEVYYRDLAAVVALITPPA